MKKPLARAPGRGLLAGDSPLVYLSTTRTGRVIFGVRANGDAKALRKARLQAQREYAALRRFVASQADDAGMADRLARSVRAVTDAKSASARSSTA